MNVVSTQPGKSYAVTPPADCIVTTPDGVVIATCPAGEQCIIVAPTASILTSVKALVTESFKGASVGSSAAGGVSIEQADVIESPSQSTLDNYNCYGISYVVKHGGLVKGVTFQGRTNQTVPGVAVYLKVWDAKSKKLLATSSDKATQVLSQAATWSFAPFNVALGDQLLITAHLEADKDVSTYKTGSLLYLRVTKNAAASTGLLAQNGTISTAAWIALYSIVYKGGGSTSVNGVTLADEKDLDAHNDDTVRHITATERAAWNEKLDAATASAMYTQTIALTQAEYDALESKHARVVYFIVEAESEAAVRVYEGDKLVFERKKEYLPFVEGPIVSIAPDEHYSGTLSANTEHIVPELVSDGKPHEIVLELYVTGDVSPSIVATPMGEEIALTAGAWFILFKWHSQWGGWCFTGIKAEG